MFGTIDLHLRVINLTPKRTRIIATSCVVLLALFSFVLIAISNATPPVRHFELMRDATVGNRFSTIVDKYGQAESRTPNDVGGTTYTYATEVDWDKFVAHWLVWIETDDRDTIVRVRSREMD